MATYVLGISGGSGAPYALRVLEGLLEGGHNVFGVITEAGRKVLEIECDVVLDGGPSHDERALLDALPPSEYRGSLAVLEMTDFSASIASGSFRTAGMVIVPCSMGTLSRVASGASSNLLERAADVTLKERRPLVLVPRETPLSLIHMRNMAAVHEAGATVFPAMPGFYHRPESVQDLVDSVAGRVLEILGVEARFLRRWTGPARLEAADLGLDDL